MDFSPIESELIGYLRNCNECNETATFEEMNLIIPCLSVEERRQGFYGLFNKIHEYLNENESIYFENEYNVGYVPIPNHFKTKAISMRCRGKISSQTRKAATNYKSVDTSLLTPQEKLNYHSQLIQNRVLSNLTSTIRGTEICKSVIKKQPVSIPLTISEDMLHCLS